MRPKIYFIAGSLLSLLGLVGAGVTTIFSLYLLRFHLTHPGPGADRKLAIILASLPWYLPLLALASIIGGYYLLRRFDFSYRKHFGYILAAIIAALWLGVYALERSPIEEFLSRRGYFNRRFNQSQQLRPSQNPTGPRFGRGQQN